LGVWKFLLTTFCCYNLQISNFHWCYDYNFLWFWQTTFCCYNPQISNFHWCYDHNFLWFWQFSAKK
jgi:hypothetical protein